MIKGQKATFFHFHKEERTKSVLRYFSNKAESYDEVDKQPYWVLSDAVLWSLLRRLVLDEFLRANRRVRLLDAGGGTARWTLRTLNYLPTCEALVLDLSEDMLRVAKRKIVAQGFEHRAQILCGDVEALPEVLQDEYDLVYNLHGVLGFVVDPAQTVRELAKVVGTGGWLVSVVPNKYHALYFSIATKRLEQIDEIVEKGLVKFTDDVPPMHVFTPVLLRKLYLEAGIGEPMVFGFPISIYPGKEETTIRDSSKAVMDILSDMQTFRKILELEEEICLDQDAACRGNNLLCIGQRRS